MARRATARLPFELTHTRGDAAAAGGRKAEPLVDFIVLAEFDIDTGSTVRHQYPSPVPNYENDWFAEYMLPEGAHNREQDWTIIMLNRDKPQMDDGFSCRTPGAGGRGKEDAGAEKKAGEGDGAAEVAAGDASADEAGTAAGAVEASQQSAAAGGKPPATERLLYGLNFVRTKHDSSVRRGAVVKAMCVISRFHFLDVFRAPLIMALDSYYETPEVSVLEDLFNSLNEVDVASFPHPSPREMAFMSRGVSFTPVGRGVQEHTPAHWVHHTSVKVQKASIPFLVPLAASTDEVLASRTIRFVETLGVSTMRVYNAMLAGQRVLFVGYNHAASDVCDFVISAISLVSPPIPGLMRRAFPYANLSDLSFLEVPSYVAGVTNPMFSSHEEWWDLLVTIDLPNKTATVMTAEEKRIEDEKTAKAKGGSHHHHHHDSTGQDDGGADSSNTVAEHLFLDNHFIQGVISGIDAKLGEEWVRRRFYDYTYGLLQQAQDGASFVLLPERVRPSVLRTYQINAARVAAMLTLPCVSDLPTDPFWDLSDEDRLANGLSGIAVRADLRRIQLEHNIAKRDLERMYTDLNVGIQSEAAMQALLNLFPESKGGVETIAIGMFHASPTVRLQTVNLLRKMEQYVSTAPCVRGLNGFLATGYERLGTEVDDGTLQRLIVLSKSGDSWANRGDSYTEQQEMQQDYYRSSNMRSPAASSARKSPRGSPTPTSASTVPVASPGASRAGVTPSPVTSPSSGHAQSANLGEASRRRSSSVQPDDIKPMPPLPGPPADPTRGSSASSSSSNASAVSETSKPAQSQPLSAGTLPATTASASSSTPPAVAGGDDGSDTQTAPSPPGAATAAVEAPQDSPFIMSAKSPSAAAIGIGDGQSEDGSTGDEAS